MKNTIKSMVVLTLILIYACFLFKANAQDLIVNQVEDIEINNSEFLYEEDVYTCGQYISINYENVPYEPFENIMIDFEIITSQNVEQISYSFDAFVNIKVETMKDNVITVTLQFSDKDVRHNFSLLIRLSNNQYSTANIYGYKSNDFYFLSEAQEPIKGLLYCDYMFENNLINESEYEKIAINTTRVTTEDDIYKIVKNESYFQNIRSISSEPLLSCVSGVCSWFDGTYYHPLRNTMVVVSYPVLGSTNAYCTYTNNNGEFTVEMMLTETVEITIQIQSTSSNAEVKPGFFNSPYSSSRGPIYLEPGHDINNYIFNIEPTNTAHKAFQVLQALEYGADYIKDIRGVTPSYTDCIYPKNNNQYIGNDIIHLKEESYRFWDVVLHEYGHKIQDYFDIEDSPGGEHTIGGDLINSRGKNKGIRLAWGEGWATYYAIVVTQYYGSQLTGVYKVNDSIFNLFSYDDYGNFYEWNGKLETNSYQGEGCEGAVFSVLYDLYDDYSSSEPWDNVSFGHSIMLNASINSGAVTLSEFMSYFSIYVLSPNDGRVGEILSEYGISANNVSITSGTGTETVPPEITWKVGGNNSKPNNNFYLVIYDNNNLVLTTTEVQNVNATNTSVTSSYTFSSTLWNQLMKLSYLYITVSVVASQTDSPSTGPYYSEKIRINLPIHYHQYTHSYTESGPLYHIAYCPCGASKTEAHTFQAFKNGNKCTKCLYFTTGPIIDSQIFGINSNIIYVEEKEKYYI